MYVVAIAWLYVALMMAVAEATSSNGTVMGAVITFLLYGALPLGLVIYVMGAPARGRAIKAREQAQWSAQQSATAQPATEPPSIAASPTVDTRVPVADASSERACAVEPYAGGQASADMVAPMRKEA